MSLRKRVSSISNLIGLRKPEAGSGTQSVAAALASKTAPVLVNLGCGDCFHPDWLNFDVHPQAPSVFRHDLHQPLPLPTGSCGVVYTSHVLEHFSRALAPRFLSECHRVLVPGGILRVVVPDLEMIARLYLKYLDGASAGDPQAAQRYPWMVLELLDQMVRERSGGEMLKYWQQDPMPAEDFVIERAGAEVRRYLESVRRKPPGGSPAAPAAPAPPTEPSPDQAAQFRASGEVHKWMYDRYSLRLLLEGTGFTEIRVCAAAQSSIPNFKTYRLDLNPDGSIRKPDSLLMEARKP